MGIKASSQVTVVDVTDAYSVTLTSETYTFLGDTTGAPAGSSCTTQAVAYRGDKICSVEVSKIQCPSGITAEVADDEGNVGSIDDEGNVVFTDDEGNVVTKRITSPTIKFTTTATIEEACEAVITTKVHDISDMKPYGVSRNSYIRSDGGLQNTPNWTAYVFPTNAAVEYKCGLYTNSAEFYAVGFYSSETEFTADTFIGGIKFPMNVSTMLEINVTSIPEGAKACVIASRIATATDDYISGYVENTLDVTIDKKFSFAVAKAGAQGEPGVAGNGIASVVRYYKLATSKPSTPTTNPPSGWTTTEPTYTSGSTNNLYLVDCTIYTDETFAFSSVSLSSSYAAAKDAYDLADGKPTLDTVKNTIKQSLANYGENLVLNGDASFLDNTNFSSFMYVNYSTSVGGRHAPFYNVNGTYGYFYSSVSRKYLDNLIPIDTDRTYEISCYTVGQRDGSGLNLGCMFYETPSLPILPAHVSWVKDTTTKLTQDLNDGDTVVYLESVEKFETTIEDYNDGLIFWDYTDVNGQTFEPETYSRHVYKSLWTDATAAIDTTNNTITLSEAWSGGTKPAGTYVSQSVGYYITNPFSGSTIKSEVYTKASFLIKSEIKIAKGELRYVSHTLGGIGTNWENDKFPSGTGYIELCLYGRGNPAFTKLSLISRDVANLLTRVTDAETSITTNKNAIELKAEKTEVTIAVDSVTKDIGDLRGDLANYATQDDYESVKTSISTLTQTSNDFTMKFQEIDSKFGDQSKYIRYSEDGIEIGYLDDESNNGVSETKKKLKLTLDNDRISFTSDGKVLGYWDGNYFYTGNIYVETKQQARFGNFAFTPYDDGSLAFVRVGE